MDCARERVHCTRAREVRDHSSKESTGVSTTPSRVGGDTGDGRPSNDPPDKVAGRPSQTGGGRSGGEIREWECG